MFHLNERRHFYSCRLLLSKIFVGLVLLSTATLLNRLAVGAMINTESLQNPSGFEWVNANPAGATPPARSGHRMVYDESRSKVVVFGGMDSQNNFLNDIWEWDSGNGTWTNVTPSSGIMPIPRANFGMAYDVARGTVLIYGGDVSTQYSNVGMTGDTWEWEGSTQTWTQKPASTIVFVGLWGAELAYDPNLQKVILFGGQPYWGWPENPSTFAWDGSNWNLASSSGPIGRVRHAMATDSGRSKVVLFGGHHRLQSGSIRLQDTWEWDGTDWIEQSPEVSPPVSYGAAMGYDTSRDVILLFGGAAPFVQDTWQWDGLNWTLRSMQGSPSPRWTALAYDSGHSTLVLFGGNDTVLPTFASGQTPLGQSSLGDTYLFGSDIAPPTTTATLSLAANDAGWHVDDVTAALDGADNDGGSGVQEITFSASGAQTISATTIHGALTSVLITGEGETTLTYFATDIAGNSEAPQSLIIKIDRTAPSLVCASTDGQWHASNVEILCSASDSVSQLANSSDVSFSLTTSVGPGTETANAATDSRTVCDNAGNCAIAGPISEIMIDKKAPTITLTTPTNAAYLLNQSMFANFSCQDGGSGVATCTGTVASGDNFDTASVGAKTFAVSATDVMANAASAQSVPYTVGFAINVLYDQTKAVRSGSVIPIKIQLVDALGHNVSSVALVVHAMDLVQIATSASETINDAGNSNPDANFRFDSTLAGGGGYIFNLKTTGLSTGTYRLGFTVDGDPTIHPVQFAVRQ